MPWALVLVVPQAVPEQFLWCVRAHCPTGGTAGNEKRCCHEWVFLINSSVAGSCMSSGIHMIARTRGFPAELRRDDQFTSWF